VEKIMKYLCLAYGAEKDWQSLPKKEQESLLAQDAAIRARGALMASVQPAVTSVRAWDGAPEIAPAAFAVSEAPLAGFSIIEAADIDEVVRLVDDTHCARAKGAIEIREITSLYDPSNKTGPGNL
jgi:hypothetical protein